MAIKHVGEVPTFGFSAAHHWIKLRVFNLEDRPLGRILEVNNPISIPAIFAKYAATSQLYAAGDDGPFSRRPIAHLNYQFPLEMAPNSSREFLLQVSSGD